MEAGTVITNTINNNYYRSTQPGHPSVARNNEQQLMGCRVKALCGWLVRGMSAGCTAGPTDWTMDGYKRCCSIIIKWNVALYSTTLQKTSQVLVSISQDCKSAA